MREPGPAPAPAAVPRIGELYGVDAEREGQWEGMRVGNRLHLYCYLRGMVVALTPLDLAPERPEPIRR